MSSCRYRVRVRLILKTKKIGTESEKIQNTRAAKTADTIEEVREACASWYTEKIVIGRWKKQTSLTTRPEQKDNQARLE